MDPMNRFVNVMLLDANGALISRRMPVDGDDEDVGHLKTRIQIDTGRAAVDQILLRDTGKAPLIDDTAVLATLDHPWEGRLAMDLWLGTKLAGRPLMLRVRVSFKVSSDNAFTVVIRSDATLDRLKRRINERGGVPPLRQILELRVVMGKKYIIVPLSDLACTLQDVIPAGNVNAGRECEVFVGKKNRRNILQLLVELPTAVGLSADGTTIKTNIQADVDLDTVNTLKFEIRKRLSMYLGDRAFNLLTADLQVRLNDGAATLVTFGIGPGASKINLVLVNNQNAA